MLDYKVLSQLIILERNILGFNGKRSIVFLEYIVRSLNITTQGITLRLLGIRTAPTQLRYALIEVNNGDCNLINTDDESQIKVPAGMNDFSEMLSWQKDEIDRIIRQNQDVEKIILKIGEYGRSDTKSSRLAAYFDAVVILAAKEANITIETKIYNQLGTKRAQVKAHAEDRVGRTGKYWNEQIADAIVAAWSGR